MIGQRIINNNKFNRTEQMNTTQLNKEKPKMKIYLIYGIYKIELTIKIS